MLKNLLVIAICLAFIASIACNSAPTPNTNSANANVLANLPPEFSANKMTPGATPTPGIPDPKNINVNKPPKGAAPTPGIPAPEDLGKPLPKGATPTPGIPSEEELKKMANRTVSIEEVNNPKGAANRTNGARNPRKQKKPPQ